MTARLDHAQLLHRDELVAPPALPLERACADHSFGLPAGIYVAMASLFAGMMGVLAFAFRTDMAISYAVVFAFLTAFFALPAIFVKAARGQGTKALSWDEFLDNGIDTLTGRTPAREAVTLVLALPLLIFGWAVSVAIIAAVVG